MLTTSDVLVTDYSAPQSLLEPLEIKSWYQARTTEPLPLREDGLCRAAQAEC